MLLIPIFGVILRTVVRLKGLIVGVTLIAGTRTTMGATRKVADPARPVDLSKCDLTMPSSSILVPTRMWWYVEQSLGVVSNSMLLQKFLNVVALMDELDVSCCQIILDFSVV
jgi:hypothetical protein